MRNKNNFKALIKQELVDRFEELTKAEIREHVLYIENTDKKIEDLKKENQSLRDDIATIKKTQFSFFNEIKEIVGKEKENINATLNLYLTDIRKHLERFHAVKTEIENKKYITKEALEKMLEEIQEGIVKTNSFCESLFTKSEAALNENNRKKFREIDSELEDFKCAFEGIFDVIGKNGDLYDKFTVENEGYVRELKILKKDLFILEKKYEYLMTRMDRILKENQ